MPQKDDCAIKGHSVCERVLQIRKQMVTLLCSNLKSELDMAKLEDANGLWLFPESSS